MAEFVRRVVTYRLYEKLINLEQSLNGDNENLIQRNLGQLHEALEYNSDKVQQYFEDSLVSESNTDKQNLINCLKFVGAPNKDDVVYISDWERLLDTLRKCSVITKDEFQSILDRLQEKWEENEVIRGYLES